MNPIITPQKFVNKNLNNTLEIPTKTKFLKRRVPVSLNEVVKYSTNNALFFYCVANVFNAYIMANSNLNQNQKYIYIAVSLYLTQIIYNYLDLNSRSNLDKLEILTNN